jgi:hypothetical protein
MFTYATLMYEVSMMANSITYRVGRAGVIGLSFGRKGDL